MEFVSLELENFGCYSQSKIDFGEFSTAVIVGKAKDNYKHSNGTGKSTLFAAIKYVLFNDVDTSSLDKLIRHGTDFCRVAIVLKVKDDEYKIIRSKTKKTSDVRLFKKNNDEWVDLTQRRGGDTEKEIEKIVRLNSKTFCNSILFQQADLSGLASATPSDKKKILKDILQLGVYTKYEAIAKKRAMDLLKEIEKSKVILQTIGSPANDLVVLGKEHKEISGSLSEQTKSLSQATELLDSIQKNNFAMQRQYDELDKQSSDLYSEFKLLKENLILDNAACNDQANRIAQIKQAIDVSSDKIETLSKKMIEFESLSLNKDDCKLQIDKLLKEIADKKALGIVKSQMLKDLNISIPDNGMCKHCRQSISHEARKECQRAIDLDKKMLNEELLLLKKDLLNLDKTYGNMGSKLAQIMRIEQDVNAHKQNSTYEQTKLNSNMILMNEFDALLKRSIAQRDERQKQFKDISSKLEALNAKEADHIKGLIAKSVEQIKILSDRIEVISRVKNGLSNNEAILLHKIEQRNKDLVRYKDLVDSIRNLENRYALYQKVVQAFGSKGIPALITQTILDDLQIEANQLFSQLRPGLQLQFQVIKDRTDGDREDTLNIIFILNSFELEYSQLSGAQKIIAALVLRLAVSSVMKKRLGVNTNILLLDEVDQSLDENALEAFEQSIKTLSNWFKILIITHNNELKTKFTTNIVVEQDRNFVSTARVVNG